MATMRTRAPSRRRPALARRPAWALPRHPGDAVRLLVGVAILVVSSAIVGDHRVGVLETNVFRLVNDLPGWLFPLFWLVMQAGNLLAVAVAAGLAAAARRFRLAAGLAIGGAGVWLLARLIKELIGRGRPPDLLGQVNIRGAAADGLLGYVSGHAAVSVAMATIASPYLGRRARRIVWVAAALVCASRVYVGAHLPLDVIGGAALGWAAGSLVLLLFGAPGGRPDAARAARALAERGIEAVEVTPLGGRDARRSARFHAVTAGGEHLFVKLIPRERRDADLAYRAWRRLFDGATAERGGGGAGSPERQVEREAYLGLLAAAAGVRTPRVILAGPYGNGAGLLVQRLVPGRSLEERDPAEIGDPVLAATWREVARLHDAGIAHGDLGRHSVVVDDGGRPWLVDFDHAQPAASQRLRAADLAELLAGLAVRFGAERAVASARTALDQERLARALTTRPSDLPRATRRELRAHPGLWDELTRLAGAAHLPRTSRNAPR
jgi:glycosyltransferase 2 family protein